MNKLTIKDRVLGGLWGAVVGDALGVPVEFRGRSELQSNPVTDLRGHGTHSQPKGTWSDDSSLMLCTVDSLLAHSFDTEDMGRRFVQWSRGKLWTPWGSVFDIGGATRQALSRIEQGVPAEQAGGTSENSNGNGSLMRILPIGLRFADEPPERLLDYVHRASAITHRHPRSQMACGLYCLTVTNLLRGQSPAEAHATAAQTFRAFCTKNPFAVEMPHFEAALSYKLATVEEREIPSSGYVADTLTASLWCLLTSKDYKQTVLKAVNLGEDTDTTGIVAGGLAGVCHGMSAVPEIWRGAMVRSGELETIFNRFATSLSAVVAKKQKPDSSGA